MRQVVNIKRVQIDSELKVTVVAEFIASDRAGKENVFRLIEMQGDVVEASFMPSQQNMPFDELGRVEEAEPVGV